uniref:Protein kinase domain-containing protein n=1 Tax=Branchiostoma floridae TaxID=7739 RepID=C3ZXG1_BRAFL|eukprot:XP_002586775.1 hypothetical protein BRAFLDRAFT_81399 [Branchiostoma floridae]
MKRLKHDHVVTAMDVPDPLKPSIDHLPFLAMEFCSGGDLRKVLSRPENYCGMKEIDVRNVVRHVGRPLFSPPIQTQLITSKGYPCEDHYVTTDGFTEKPGPSRLACRLARPPFLGPKAIDGV